MITYRIPPGVQPARLGWRIFLRNAAGGQVWVDAAMLELWQAANGRSLAEILSCPLSAREMATTRAALSCLAEAGFLLRELQIAQEYPLSCPEQDYFDDPLPPQSMPEGNENCLVSVILVGYNSRPWLENCLAALLAQTYTPLEIVFIDNASQDDSGAWMQANYPQIRQIRLAQTQSLAGALNRGIQLANGAYYCLLNPDVTLSPAAIANMVRIAQQQTSCAAVAAKLRLLWTPAFLNGLGNFVGAFSWGVDHALGRLDLGQFDDLGEIPSACFAAALIPATVFQAVGALDERFPMYYEDSEWCYRARLFGYSVQAAPGALAYHAFGAYTPADKAQNLSAEKLRRVVYGRLRFIVLINGQRFLLRFLTYYILEDGLRFTLAVLGLRRAAAWAYIQAWNDFFQSLPELKLRRQSIQIWRQRSDAEIYRLQKNLPAALIWRGFPILTWEVIDNEYLPLIAAGRTRPLPEFAPLDGNVQIETELTRPKPFARRALRLWQTTGLKGLLYWIGKHVQWRLMQPGI